MTVSRASAILATLVGWTLSCGPAVAQDTPIQTPVPPSMPSNPLDRIGLVDTRSANIPGWTWYGTTMAAARALVLDLPAAPQSRVLRDLQFRLLTAGATPPRPDGATPLLFTLRVEKLAAMGEAENAHELLRQGSGGEGPMTSRIVTEALMRARQRDSACARVQGAVEHADEAWWREAAIVCHLHARQNDAARAKLDAARGHADATFVALAGRILGGNGAGPSLSPTDDGLILALIDIAGLPTPTTNFDSPGVLRAAIENKAIPLSRRVELAERAERSGVIEPERLVDFYTELARGLKSAPATSPTAWRAVVFAQAQGAASNEQRAVLAHRLIEVSRDTAGSALRALSSAIGEARPTPAHADFAAAGLLGAMTVERFDRASEWFKAAQSGSTNEQIADRMALLAPLAAIARLPNRLPLDEKLMARRAALRPQTAAALHAVLSALDAAPRDVLALLAAGAAQRSRDPAIVALLAAAEAERFAETICRVAALAGSTPVASLEPEKVAAILRALVRIDRGDVARSFAVEYALLAGL